MDIEKILLVVIDEKRKDGWMKEDIAQELEELVIACGGNVVDKYFCRMSKPSATYLIGEGHVQELADLCSTIDVNTIVFSQDLKGRHQRNLEKRLNVKTIDRTQMILDIFARHARSREGKMQVELAQLEYLLPRLVGKGVLLSRLGGGIGTLGPGETKLEVDRRRISQKITLLKKNLQNVAQNRALKRKKRKDQGVPLVSLIGYTNAGKSTLLNTLTQADQTTRDGLFTTLDPLSRQLVLPNNQKIILSDTVGFMHELPHHLIESFHATLEEVIEADLLIHVLDISQPRYRYFYDSVLDVLVELAANQKTIITVLNKIDKIQDKYWIKDLQDSLEDSVPMSALSKENLSQLFEKIQEKLSALMVSIDVLLPINRMDLVHSAHQEGKVQTTEYFQDTIHLRAQVPKKLSGMIKKSSVR